MSNFFITDRAEKTTPKKLTATSDTELLAAGNNFVTIDEIYIANISGSSAKIDIWYTDGTTSWYLTKGKAVPANDELVLKRTIKLEQIHTLKAKADTTDAFDVIVSSMEISQRGR